MSEIKEEEKPKGAESHPQGAEKEKGGKPEHKKDRKASEQEKKIASLEEQLSKAEDAAKAAEAAAAKEKDDYLRLMAEFETFRRRSAEERLSLVSTAASDTIKGLLPVLDDCERAISILAESKDEAAKEGTTLIYDKLLGYLKGKGLESIKAKGEKFDTDFHEAVTQFPVQDEAQKGMVIDVVQTGYTLNGKILRYAKVVVGA